MRRSLLALGFACFAAHGGLTPAAAQTLADYDYENLTFRGVGVDWGYIWPTKVRNTSQYGLRLDLGYLGPGVRIIPSISYWRSKLTDREIEDLATRINNSQTGVALTPDSLGPIEWSDFALSVDGHFVWNTPINVLTFAGAGLAFHALNGQGAAIDDTIVEDLLDSISTGVSFLAGAEFEPIEQFRIYVEGRYTALSSFQYLSARSGVQFMFGGSDRVQVGAAVPAPSPPYEGGTP